MKAKHPVHKKKPIIPTNTNNLPLETDLKKRFERLSQTLSTDPSTQNDPGHFSFALFTEKPVYQPGESVQVSLYVYDKWSKKPLQSPNKSISIYSLLVEVKDANDGKVATLSGKINEISGINSFRFDMSEEIKGGFYKIEARHLSNLVDSTKFFVTSVKDRRNAVTLDVNKDTLTANDEVIGKVHLKMLTKGDEFFAEGAPGEKLNYSVKIMDQDFGELEIIQKQLTCGSGMFSFHTPSNLKGLSSVIILVEIFVEGEKLETTRQLSIKTLKDLFIRFVPDGGKYSLGFTNNVYFASFAGENEKVAISVNNGHVLERDVNDLNSEVEIVSNIVSNEDGRGKIAIKIKKNKEYVFVAKEGKKSKRFLILSESDFLSNSDEKMSVVNMQTDKKVFKWGEDIKLTIQKQKKVMNKEFKLVLIDKLKLYSEDLLKIEENKMEHLINLKNLNLKNGGVYTIQLYKSGNTSEAVQETLIYIEPKEKLPITIKFDKQKYSPKDQVNLEIDISSSTEGFVGVVVSDETPFLEIEKRNNPVSMCSKVFLEKELHFKSKEWVNSVKFIDDFFENNDTFKENNQSAKDDLECLLGVQDWRLFFLTEEKIKNYIKNPKQGFGDSLRHLLGLSTEKINKILNPPRQKLFGKRRSKIK